MYGSDGSSYRGYSNDRRGHGQRTYSNNRRSFGQDSVSEMNPNSNEVTFRKDFSELLLSSLSQEAAVQLRQESSMRLIGNDIPLPIEDFKSINFPSEVQRYFEKKGYLKPTTIQAQGWPMALKGKDMVGIADTGSGKTISFVLPALIHAKNQESLREDDGPIVLILAPTRELVTQIEEVVREYASFFDLRSASVYGGVSIIPQKKLLKRGVEILVATPGRLIDLHKQGFCPLNRVSFLVLDEADRMLDMGFEPQLNQIIPQTNKTRQSLMWSATWPREVRSLAMNYLTDFIQVTIGSDSLKANSKITQKVDLVSWQDKKTKLLFYLQDKRSDRVIIFCNMKRTCDVIEEFLHEKRFMASAIHGDKTQAARDTVISNFKAGRKPILIATDVAARGLDVENVALVINFDFPKQVEDYVHRIGRTARGSAKEGLAYTMFTSDDAHNASKLIDILRGSNQVISEELSEMAKNNRGGYGNQQRGRGGNNYGRGGNRGSSYGDRTNNRY